LNQLQLDKNLVSLSQAEGKALAKYLKANILLLECKDAANSLSREDWEAIEEELLRV